ncbi:MAG TPA: sulfite exporter TauE/SafE family protein [Clostridia bacterium]|nr:sulfite exporter TauE/SafE family protein [Clostridia bacterium]
MKKQNKKALIAGLVTGICNGLFGAGGGMVAVFALQSLTGYEQARAHATAISIMLPLTTVSALVYISNSAVDWNAVLYVAPSLTLGSVIGAKLTGKLSPKWLNRIFSALMLFAAVWMLFAPSNKS